VCIYARRGDLLLEKHRTQQSEERKKLGKHRKKCLSDPQKYIGIVIDGMDKKKQDSRIGIKFQNLPTRVVFYKCMLLDAWFITVKYFLVFISTIQL
jgi:hypothetical protein